MQSAMKGTSWPRAWRGSDWQRLRPASSRSAISATTIAGLTCAKRAAAWAASCAVTTSKPALASQREALLRVAPSAEASSATRLAPGLASLAGFVTSKSGIAGCATLRLE